MYTLMISCGDTLDLAHLKRFVSDLADGLDYECGEGCEALRLAPLQLFSEPYSQAEQHAILAALS